MRSSDPHTLALEIDAARQRSLALFDAFEPRHPGVPWLPIINPPCWELGHVGYFQEYWCLRRGWAEQAGTSRLPQADAWFDSNKVAHASRWQLALPGAGALKSYLASVQDDCLAALAQTAHEDRALYFFRLALFHELMHAEAFTYTLQTLGRACPPQGLAASWRGLTDQGRGGGDDLDLPAASITLGSAAGRGFVFDNEKYAHPLQLPGYAISARPVSAGQFRSFVEAGGYAQAQWWDPPAWQQLQAEGRALPRYWRRTGTGFEARRFDRWLPLDDDEAMVHVDAHEARAWCRWAGRRLPTEAEWQHAAETRPDFDWGREVWEWTDTVFAPYPGFSPDPYQEYSAPWFHDHWVVRGASFATPRAMVSTRFRNFYKPGRGDPFLGFRSCAR